jgi:hypothetical protein
MVYVPDCGAVQRTTARSPAGPGWRLSVSAGCTTFGAFGYECVAPVVFFVTDEQQDWADGAHVAVPAPKTVVAAGSAVKLPPVGL